MGSGTTAVACARHGREFVGYEINADYHAIAERRVAETRSVGIKVEPQAVENAVTASIDPGYDLELNDCRPRAGGLLQDCSRLRNSSHPAHLGRFAREYLAMFGEHPSDTLHRQAG